MRENSFILVVLFLSVGLVVGLTLWSDHGGQDSMWSPNDVYSKHAVMSRASSTFTSASYSSGMINDGVALTIRHRSFGSSRALVPTYSYARNTVGTSTYNQSSFASSPSGGLHTTSSAEFRSFGGGGMSAGVSMSSGSRSVASNGPIAQLGGVYTSMPTGVLSSSLSATNNMQMPISGNEMMAMNNPANDFSSASASAYSGWGKTTALYGTATYGGNGSNRISGRRNSDQGSGNSEGYQSWLDWMKKLGFNVGSEEEGSVNTFVFSTEQAYEAFLLWFFMNHGYEYDPNNQTSQIIYEEWVRWYSSNGGVHTDGDWTFKFSVPVGDVLPMIFFILMYLVFVGLRRYKQLQKSIK